MKNFKKVLAIILAMAMFFALSMTAFAYTHVSTTEDTTVLTLTADDEDDVVSYQAVTVDGDAHNETITVYTYCVKTSNSSADLSFTNPGNYSVYLNNTLWNSNGFTLAKNTHNTLELKSGTTVVRSFEIAVVDADSVSVSIEINCYNAYEWLIENPDDDIQAIFNGLGSTLGFNGIGKMNNVVTLTNLPAGSTAMDALYALMDSKGFSIAGSGSAAGHLQNHNTVYTYISSIGGLEEMMCDYASGWCYVTPSNTSPYYTMPMMAASSYALTEGEHIIWVYTTDFFNLGDAITATVSE